MTFIELNNITKKFDFFKALKSISLEIEKDKLLGLIGHNGSGKTTLLRILATLSVPSQGEYLYKGEKIGNLYQLKDQTTLVFQKAKMFNRSVKKNISYGLRTKNLPKSKIEKGVEEGLELIKMQDQAEKNAKKISGGEKQRVALARAFATNPELLLLDEPTSNIDPGNSKIIEDAIKKISDEKDTTVILATHTLFQTKRLSDRTAHLYDGKIVEEGKTEKVFENPKNEKTKKFISGKLIT